MIQRKYKAMGIGFAILGVLGTVVLIYFSYISAQKNTSSGSENRTVLVSYTNSGFQPSSISVELGTQITFKNNSLKPFQPMSDAGFGAQRCDNDYRGACEPILPGGSWSVRFDNSQAGGAYYDELQPSARMTISVVTLPGDMQPTLCDGVPCKI
jgi:hypothetical protein